MATDGEAGRGQDKQNFCYVLVVYLEKNVMSAQMLVSPLGVGLVLRLESDACGQRAKNLGRETKDFPPPPRLPGCFGRNMPSESLLSRNEKAIFVGNPSSRKKGYLVPPIVS